MVKYNIISTGSDGNATILEDFVLVDCGVPYKALEPYVPKLKLVLLTHIHSDHFQKRTIKRLASERPTLRFGCCRWLVPPLIAAGVPERQIDVLTPRTLYGYGLCNVIPVMLAHNVPNCGYKVHFPSGKVIYATDTNNLDGIQAIGYDLYLIESNYRDEDIQAKIQEKKVAGQYAYELQVLRNHLSEAKCNDFLARNMKANSVYIPMHVHVDNDFTYDPFSILIEEARARGLFVHAWINPLRGVTTSELQKMDMAYALRQWYEDTALRGQYIVEYNGRWYLNPAYAEVRDLIVYGAREILQRYDVDGIHMDDYFYPTQDASFDADAYAAYRAEGGTMSPENWRRENLSDLVSRLYRMTKRQNPHALFGISPAGVLNTVYAKQYADVYRWCAEPGFVDYILPQIYFGFEHATAAFDKLCNQWQELVRTEYVDLLIGVTFGKALAKYDKWAGTGANEWAQHTDIMARCITYTLGLEKCRGMSVFCYQYFYDPVTGVPVAGTQEERDGYIAILREASWED